MMIRNANGRTGQIDSFTQQENDSAITCMACSRIIVSKTNLGDKGTCPYCHQPVNLRLSTRLFEDDDADNIAQPC